MLDFLNNLNYCRTHENEDNVSKILSLSVSKESNAISFANINILLNNDYNCQLIANLSKSDKERFIKRIPSQFRTLLSLDTFNSKINRYFTLEDVQFVKSFDYNKMSSETNKFSTTTALNNDSLTQLVMAF